VTTRLAGKVAIVTGAARGQGEAEARRFAAEGAKVVIADVLDDVGEKVAADIGHAARFEHLDVTSEESWTATVAATVEAFGGVHVLVNNAGILGAFNTIERLALDDYMKTIMVNQVGTFLGMKHVAGAMADSGGGSIVNISSIGGLRGIPLSTAYVASKFAVRGMTKTAAMELGPKGIRVNSVHPGGVATEMTAAVGDTGESKFYKRLPISRIGTPDDIANLVLFLAPTSRPTAPAPSSPSTAAAKPATTLSSSSRSWCSARVRATRAPRRARRPAAPAA
jgi:3alpha(or 20beta)-hydroxysteroid dehydrogenase